QRRREVDGGMELELAGERAAPPAEGGGQDEVAAQRAESRRVAHPLRMGVLERARPGERGVQVPEPARDTGAPPLSLLDRPGIQRTGRRGGAGPGRRATRGGGGG